MIKRHVKICSASLIIREKEIKTTMRYHVTWSEWPSSKKSLNNKYWRGCGENRTFYTVGGNVNWYRHYKEQYRVS